MVTVWIDNIVQTRDGCCENSGCVMPELVEFLGKWPSRAGDDVQRLLGLLDSKISDQLPGNREFFARLRSLTVDDKTDQQLLEKLYEVEVLAKLAVATDSVDAPIACMCAQQDALSSGIEELKELLLVAN